MDRIPQYNPLDQTNLAEATALAAESSDAYSLGDLSPVWGAGIYLIYYLGGFPTYERLACTNSETLSMPIYVGKATPAGGRKGQIDTGVVSTALMRRLSQHADSIDAAENLDLGDFYFRYLPVDDIFIPLGERGLISRYRPVWNAIIDGFGNHNPGAGRHKGARTRWDTLHPGRAWAENLAPRPETPEEVSAEAEEYLRSRLV